MKVKWKSLTRVRLCDPMEYTVHGILQARIVEWVAFPFSRESSQSRNQTQVSHVAGRFLTSWARRYFIFYSIMNRKGRETRDQIANICWIIEKAQVQESVHFCFVDCFCFEYSKAIFIFCESTLGFALCLPWGLHIMSCRYNHRFYADNNLVSITDKNSFPLLPLFIFLMS